MLNNKPLTRSLVVLYSAFLLSLAYFAIPIENFLRAYQFYGFAFHLLLASFLAAIITIVWCYRARLNAARILISALIFACYVILYRSTPFDAEKLHLVTYSVLAILYRASIDPHESNLRADFLAVIAASLLGLTDEFLQCFIPGRYFGWNDVFYNTSASSLILVLRNLFLK